MEGADMEENNQGWNHAIRRGGPGEGERPWVAVWLVLLDRAQAAAGHSASRRSAWRAALGAFLLEFRRHPARIHPWEIREYLFSNAQLGAADSPLSLTLVMETLGFFYTSVVPRPALAEAARRPFEVRPDWEAAADSALVRLLRERLVDSGAAGFGAPGPVRGDWHPSG